MQRQMITDLFLNDCVIFMMTVGISLTLSTTIIKVIMSVDIYAVFLLQDKTKTCILVW